MITGATLQGWRAANGLTQVEAAAYFGVTERTVQRWEARRTLPKRIARLVQVVSEQDPPAPDTATYPVYTGG